MVKIRLARLKLASVIIDKQSDGLL
jgi:hypothetical protein